MNRHYARLPDGSSVARNTDRVYTHVVVGRRGDGKWQALGWSGSMALAQKALARAAWPQALVVEVTLVRNGHGDVLADVMAKVLLGRDRGVNRNLDAAGARAWAARRWGSAVVQRIMVGDMDRCEIEVPDGNGVRLGRGTNGAPGATGWWAAALDLLEEI